MALALFTLAALPTGFGKIILPFTLLRRLECVLEPTREGVRESHAAFKDAGIDIDLVLRQATRYGPHIPTLVELAESGELD